MKQSNPCPNYKTAYFWSNAVCEPGDEAAAISFNPSPSTYQVKNNLQRFRS
jgi:hypothetical protein